MLKLSTIINGVEYPDIPAGGMIELGDFIFNNSIDFWLSNTGPSTQVIKEVTATCSPTGQVYLDPAGSDWVDVLLHKNVSKIIRILIRDYGPVEFYLRVRTANNEYCYCFTAYIVAY